MLENSDIPHLPPSATLPIGALAAIWNPQSGQTESFDLSTLLPSSADYRWISTHAYALGEISTYNGKIWQSLSNGNTAHIPQTGSTFWSEVSKANSGLQQWQAGAYTDPDVYILFNLSGIMQLFRLLDPARPYNSTNFLAEYGAGKWVLASGDKYIAVQKNAHGFVVDKILKFAGGTWVPFDGTGTPVLQVRGVPDANTFYAVVIGSVMRGFAGLTPGDLLYIQNDGTISTVSSDRPYMQSISATEAIQLMGSGGGGDFWPLAGLGTLSADVTIDGAANDLTFDNFASFTAKTFDDNILMWATNGEISLYSEDSPASTEWVRLTISIFGSGFADNRAVPVGLEYLGDYSANYTARSLVDKAFVLSQIGGANYWPLDGPASLMADVDIDGGGLYGFNLGTPANPLTDVSINSIGTINIESTTGGITNTIGVSTSAINITGDSGVLVKSNDYVGLENSDASNAIYVDDTGVNISVAAGLFIYLPGTPPSDGDVLTFDALSGQTLWATAGGGGSGFWPLNGGATLTGTVSINGGAGLNNVSIGVPGGLLNQLDLYATRVRINGDPNYNSILGWDDTDGTIKHYNIGAGLSYNAGTDTLSVGSGGPYWPLSGAATLTASVTITGSVFNGISWNSQGAWNVNFAASSGGLNMFTALNAGLTISDTGSAIQQATDQILLVQNFVSAANNANITDQVIMRKRVNAAGAGGAGIGMRLVMQMSSASGAPTYRGNQIESVLTTAVAATSRGELRFGVSENAAVVNKLVIDEFGAKYLADYSANYTVRSVVDKGYADSLKGKNNSFTVGTVPSAAANEGSTIYVSNESGGKTLAFSDGVDWRRLYDNTIIS